MPRNCLWRPPLPDRSPFSPVANPTSRKYRKQGISQYIDGIYDQSLATLKTALSDYQFDAQSNTYAGLIEYRQGNYQQASYYFKVALQSDPSQEQAVSGLTAAYIRLGKPDLSPSISSNAAPPWPIR